MVTSTSRPLPTFNSRKPRTISTLPARVSWPISTRASISTHPALQGVLLPGWDFTRNQAGGNELNDVNMTAPPPCNSCPAAYVNQHTAAMLDQHTAHIAGRDRLRSVRTRNDGARSDPPRRPHGAAAAREGLWPRRQRFAFEHHRRRLLLGAEQRQRHQHELRYGAGFDRIQQRAQVRQQQARDPGGLRG